MESLSYYLEARGSAFSEDIEFPVELLARSKNYVKDWDNKVLSDFCKTMPSFDREIVDNMEVSETNFSDTMGKLDLGNPGLRASTDKFTDDSTNVIASTSMANIDPLLWEGFTSKFPVDAAESYYRQKESTIDPNLDGWTASRKKRWTASRKKDHLPHPEENLVSPLVEDALPAKRIRTREANSLPYSEENSVPSLVEDSSPAKRARTTNLLSQFPVCQVHGCHKDLSSSKDYHKRHRVCDVHSKTAKVIINGIEKRFCQQCSRFHLLTEFDDDKRSCRKRLAGHNERRRKPQLGAHLGSEFLEMTLLKRISFLSPETFPAGFFYQERFEKDNHSRHIKFLEVPSDKSQSVVALNGRFCHVPNADQHIIYNQQPSKTCTDTAVAVELSVLRDSSSALSLLSAQSQNTSSGSAGISMALPQVNGIDVLAYKGTDQNSVNNLEMGTLKSFTSNGYSPGKIDDEGMARAHDGGVPLSFKVQREGTFQVSDYRHANCSPPFEVGTLDLLQLSLHLQRVEEQKNSLQVKQENEIFCSSATL